MMEFILFCSAYMELGIKKKKKKKKKKKLAEKLFKEALP